MNKKIIYGMVFAGSVVVAVGNASAAVTIDFQTLGQASVGGKPNLSGASTAGMYTEDGFRVGIVNDPLDGISHLHKLGAAPANVSLQYHSDSSGIYIRALDDSAFSLTSMDFHSPYDSSQNPHTVGGSGNGSAASDFWHIYGFSDARNPNMLNDEVASDGYTPTDPNGGNPTRPAVAHATVANGIDVLALNLLSPGPNLLSLEGSFANIKSFWIHYNGFPHSPNAYINPNDPNSSAYQFGMEIDNINLVPAAIPVPAAVWMFLSGMLGLLAIGKRKAHLAA